MTVAELIEALKDVPGNLPIMTSADPEGNGLWPLEDISKGVSFYDGSVYDAEEMEDFSDYKKKNSVPVICLWPGYEWKNVRKE